MSEQLSDEDRQDMGLAELIRERNTLRERCKELEQELIVVEDERAALGEDRIYAREQVSCLTAERDELKAARRIHELDNHHNAILCPYCNGPIKDEIQRLTTELAEAKKELQDLHNWELGIEAAAKESA